LEVLRVSFDICRQAVNVAIKAGAEEAETLLIERRSTTVQIERAEIKTATSSKDMGIGVRAITDRKMGFAYTNRITADAVEKTARVAARASRASLRDKNWRQLPEGKSYPTVKEVFDNRFAEVNSDEVVAFCIEMMEAAVNVDKRVLPAFGGVELETQNMTCLNSHGLEVEDKGTDFVCYLGTMARSETQVSPMCIEFQASRMYEPKQKWVGSEAGRLAIQSINVGKAEGGKFPVLLDSFALESIFNATLIPSVRGDNVSRGNSKLKDKIGSKIASDSLGLLDDGTRAGGLRSGKADMEGVPRQRTPIIEKGRLHGFLYDNYWGRIEGKESTGNAGRGGGRLLLPPYGTLPTISPSNVVIEPGTASEQELLAQVKNGYYVRDVQGAHQSNPETGEFSVAIAPAWRILNGEITHAVKGAMIAGNLYDMINNISLVGKESRQLGTFITPKIVIDNLDMITG
jgi:PmbA protein